MRRSPGRRARRRPVRVGSAHRLAGRPRSPARAPGHALWEAAGLTRSCPLALGTARMAGLRRRPCRPAPARQAACDVRERAVGRRRPLRRVPALPPPRPQSVCGSQACPRHVRRRRTITGTWRARPQLRRCPAAPCAASWWPSATSSWRTPYAPRQARRRPGLAPARPWTPPGQALAQAPTGRAWSA